MSLSSSQLLSHLLVALPAQSTVSSPAVLPVTSSDFSHELETLYREVVLLRQQNAELMTLRQEVDRLRRENQDLHLTLEAITEHGDAIEQELQATNDRLRMAAEVDGLTHLANRRKFDQYLALQWRDMGQLQHPLALILCDIDYFKQFNDFYGHLQGDDCLKQVAQILGASIKRAGDLLARYGGEEFVVVLPNTGLAQAEVVAERMRHAVVQQQIPHLRSGIGDHITLSLGIASWVPDAQTSPQGLINQADRCLYCAKNQGRNRIVSHC